MNYLDGLEKAKTIIAQQMHESLSYLEKLTLKEVLARLELEIAEELDRMEKAFLNE